MSIHREGTVPNADLEANGSDQVGIARLVNAYRCIRSVNEKGKPDPMQGKLALIHVPTLPAESVMEAFNS